jgi:hypothetical protein
MKNSNVRQVIRSIIEESKSLRHALDMCPVDENDFDTFKVNDGYGISNNGSIGSIARAILDEEKDHGSYVKLENFMVDKIKTDLRFTKEMDRLGMTQNVKPNQGRHLKISPYILKEIYQYLKENQSPACERWLKQADEFFGDDVSEQKAIINEIERIKKGADIIESDYCKADKIAQGNKQSFWNRLVSLTDDEENNEPVKKILELLYHCQGGHGFSPFQLKKLYGHSHQPNSDIYYTDNRNWTKKATANELFDYVNKIV